MTDFDELSDLDDLDEDIRQSIIKQPIDNSNTRNNKDNDSDSDNSSIGAPPSDDESDPDEMYKVRSFIFNNLLFKFVCMFMYFQWTCYKDQHFGYETGASGERDGLVGEAARHEFGVARRLAENARTQRQISLL